MLPELAEGRHRPTPLAWSLEKVPFEEWTSTRWREGHSSWMSNLGSKRLCGNLHQVEVLPIPSSGLLPLTFLMVEFHR